MLLWGLVETSNHMKPIESTNRNKAELICMSATSVAVFTVKCAGPDNQLVAFGTLAPLSGKSN